MIIELFFLTELQRQILNFFIATKIVLWLAFLHGHNLHVNLFLHLVYGLLNSGNDRETSIMSLKFPF